MNAYLIAAIVAISAIEGYYLVSEIRLRARTTRGADKTADKGSMQLVWILSALAYILAWVPVALDSGRLVTLGDWLTWVGVFIMISGIGFRQYAISTLGKFFTSSIQIKKDHAIIRTGPYRYIRHPSYLGILTLAVGLGIALANWISLIVCVVLPAIALINRIQFEEKELEKHFGPQYQDYRKHTWRIIPYLY